MRQFEREENPGERRAHGAAEDRAHADQRPESDADVGQKHPASRPPSAAPIISSGASTPPEVPDPSETTQMIDLTRSMPRITVRGTSPCSSAPMVS